MVFEEVPKVLNVNVLMKISNLVSGYPLAPRSTRSKLKIAFVATLIVLTVAIPSYLYDDSLIPKPAKFKVEELVFDQSWVQVGTPVEISVDITNVGDKSGNRSVTLTINDEAVVTKTVQLSADETTTLFFTATELEVGNHTVTIGGLTETIKVTVEKPIRPAELQLTNLGVSRTEAGIGETITVSTTAANIGDLAGEFSLELLVNDQKQETKSVQLDGGETTIVTFDVAQDAEGEYVIKLGTLTTAFTVSADAQPVKPADFQVSDLTVSPSSVLADEIVEISIMVTNIGEESGSYTVDLTVDDSPKQTKTVQLAGGATTVDTFEISEANAGTHTVEIDELSGAFTVTSSVDASEHIEIRSLAVSPYEVSDGDTVTIKFKATNLVNEAGTLQARVSLDGVILKQLFKIPVPS